MSDGLASVEPDGPLYRLGRQPDPWAWPDWSYAGPDGTFGNRYDDPGTSYRVLYASSQRIGAFLETLARFRPDLEVLAELERIDGDDESPPGSAKRRSRDASSTSAIRARSSRFGLRSRRVRFGTGSTRSTLQRSDSGRRARSRNRCPASSTSRGHLRASAIARDSATTCSTGRSSSPHPMRQARSARRHPPRSKLTTPTCERRSACSVLRSPELPRARYSGSAK